MNETIRANLNQYITDLFAPEDDVLMWIQAEAARSELPAISVQAHEGRLLQLLVHAIGARKIVEIGTLAGYSGVWLARALPPGGKLYTLEKSSKHAAIARNNFTRAKVDDRVELLEGAALDSLVKLNSQAPFDLVFIDADKSSYLMYLAWSIDHLRPGGMIAAHNALRAGNIITPQNDDDHTMRAFNEALAADPRLHSTILAVGDGMAVGIKKGL